MELEDDYRIGLDIEADSDVDDGETDSQLSQWLGELENYARVSGNLLDIYVWRVNINRTQPKESA